MGFWTSPATRKWMQSVDKRIKDLERRAAGATHIPHQRAPRGEWEGHPCTLPSHVGFTHVGLVWRCHCERRWRLVEIKPAVKDTFDEVIYPEIHNWQEQMSSRPISEEELMELLEGGDDADS